MLTVATLFWQSNSRSRDFSRIYSQTWVERLYQGFKRNLTSSFRFVCFVDKEYPLPPPIHQIMIQAKRPDYSTCIEPYILGSPMILCGLDTVVVGNIDPLAEYCLNETKLALPRDPYHPKIACNGVALVPSGYRKVAVEHRGQNDMEWVRRYPHVFIDDLFPGWVQSYKGHIEQHGLDDTRIVYFHGKKKPHELKQHDWIQKHWIGDKNVGQVHS